MGLGVGGGGDLPAYGCQHKAWRHQLHQQITVTLEIQQEEGVLKGGRLGD